MKHLIDIGIRVLGDLGRRTVSPGLAGSSDAALLGAVGWLCRMQDAGQDHGVAYGYSVKGGVRPSYVETTGYIAETFFRLAAFYDDQQYRDRALLMADWLCDVQLEDGSFTNDRFSPSSGIVFDTGQDLIGLELAYGESSAEKYAIAADRASDWLVGPPADNDGRWVFHTHNGIPHVYNTRVAWALLMSHQRSPAEAKQRVAQANLDWALSEERNGWFGSNAFTKDGHPFTHNIAYAIRGFLESALILDRSDYLETAERCALACMRLLREDGFLPGTIDAQGRAVSNYVCLTGNCQMSIIWAKLYRLTGNKDCRAAALRSLEYVARTQDLHTPNMNIHGAIKGSHPIWGGYSPLTYPNWATKFFVDAILECHDWLD